MTAAEDRTGSPASTTFPHGATVRELAAAIAKVPEEHLDLEFVVMVHLEAAPADDLVPALPTEFDQFPAKLHDPQPTPVTWQLYCVEGESVAAMVETMRAFREFAEEQDR